MPRNSCQPPVDSDTPTRGGMEAGFNSGKDTTGTWKVSVQFHPAGTGKVKAAVGSVIGNEQMEAEGIVKEKKGEAKQEAAKAAERTKGKIEEIVGAVKNRVGAVIDNEQMQVEGRAKELKGEARQKANK